MARLILFCVATKDQLQSLLPSLNSPHFCYSRNRMITGRHSAFGVFWIHSEVWSVMPVTLPEPQGVGVILYFIPICDAHFMTNKHRTKWALFVCVFCSVYHMCQGACCRYHNKTLPTVLVYAKGTPGERVLLPPTPTLPTHVPPGWQPVRTTSQISLL